MTTLEQMNPFRYDAAVTNFGRERFLKNHNDLLKRFLKTLDLKRRILFSSPQSVICAGRDQRHVTTMLVHNKYELPNVNKQQA